MRAMNRLTALAVQRLAKPGRHADGGGLYLLIKPSGARSWIFMYRRPEGGRRVMGLGPVHTVGLKAAREEATRLRLELSRGVNPERFGNKGPGKSVDTFEVVADRVISQLETGWRNEKHRAQWRATLATYAAPIAGTPVDKITTSDVLQVLLPIWTTKPETASRVRQRIERVLDAAIALGLRLEANPARLKGNLAHLLPMRPKSKRHHAALPWEDLPAFMRRLRLRDAISARALEFTILTAARTGETIGATWDEIGRDVWTVPAARMKAGREHRVPLTPRALEILAEARDMGSQTIFPRLSNMAMAMLLRRMDYDDITVHGFRSTFRDWCGEATIFPRELAEAALAHIVGDETERAYRRGDALSRRRELMIAWEKYISTPETH